MIFIPYRYFDNVCINFDQLENTRSKFLFKTLNNNFIEKYVKNEQEVITIATVDSDRPHAGEVLLVEVVGDGFCSPDGVNLDNQALCKKGTKI